MGIMIPHLTVLATNDFASSAVGERVHCETLKSAACTDANTAAVTWVAWSSFFQNAILSVWLLPLIGMLSDQYGRLRYMVAGASLGANAVPKSTVRR